MYRRNAGILLRRMSDDFNIRKFPEIVEEVKVRRRAQSDSSVQPIDSDGPNSDGPNRVMSYLRRLSSTALLPTDSTSLPQSKPAPLLEAQGEADSQQDE